MINTNSTDPLHQIYFYLTEGCNLRCRHCWIAPKHESSKQRFAHLDTDLFLDIIQQAKPLGLSAIKLTGGEPLMHNQISDILCRAVNEDLRLIIETNGVLCTPQIAGMIADAGNCFVSVSLDGVDAKTHDWLRGGVSGSHAAAVEGIQNLVKAGVKTQIIMSVIRRNRYQMKAAVRFAETVGANSIKFNIIMPTQRGKTLHESNEALTINELIHTGAWVENELIPESRIRVFYHHPPAFRPLGRMYGQNGDGCSACQIKGILGVLADGSYVLCGIGTSVPELVFGNAKTDRLADIWLKTPILKKIREGLPKQLEGICKHCLVKKICLGSCIAQNYYRSKNLWAPFWYCDQAQRVGLFPKSRIRP